MRRNGRLGGTRVSEKDPNEVDEAQARISRGLELEAEVEEQSINQQGR